MVKEGFSEPYLEDGRHPKPEVVQQILALFGKYYCPHDAPGGAADGRRADEGRSSPSTEDNVSKSATPGSAEAAPPGAPTTTPAGAEQSL